ncbi:MAG: potassium channel protein [Nitrospirae bacterium]|nr:potassium channel protein [Nitrospirota bacterium]
MFKHIYKKFVWAAVILFAILATGTSGYSIIGGSKYSLIDCLYMTVITISTIGFGEIIDLSASPGGRVFTMFIAFSGIGVLFYIITNVTAYVIEGELKDSFRRKKMENKAGKLFDHYIICGLGRVGLHIANELYATKRHFIAIDTAAGAAEKFIGAFPDHVFIDKDASDSEALIMAGIEKAKGLFAVTGDDNQNLVISLTAKDINPEAKVVARCNDARNSEKIKKAGADSVISPNLIGGLRMASEMLRPSVVSFLDTMLRDKGKNLRVEGVSIPQSFAGRKLSSLNIRKHPDILLLAVRRGDDWSYNPQDDFALAAGDALVFMTTPEEREKLEKAINAAN